MTKDQSGVQNVVKNLIGVIKMTESPCKTCKYDEDCNHPERPMKCMGYKRELKVGDTIKCSNKDDMVNTMNELFKAGVDTDFLYEKDGEKGLWLEVKGVNSDA